MHLEENNNPRKSYIIYGSLVFFLLLLLLSICLLNLVPPVSRDALTHHLAIPKLYIQHDGIYEIPELDFSYYPMNLDLLYIIPLYFGNDILPKFIHFLFALGTGWLIFDYLKKHISKTYGLLGCLFFLSIPIILKLSITVYVDLGLIFFSTFSLLLLFRWSEKNFQIHYLVFAAICCGLAMGTKYNGLITFFLLTAFVPILYQRVTIRTSNISAFRYALIFSCIAILTFSPWLIRNFLWTSNPLFPLFDNFFHPGRQIESDIGIIKFRQLIYNETPSQILLLPLRIFFEGKDNVPQLFDGKLNPFLLLLFPLAFISAKQHSITLQKTLLALFSVLFFLLAIFQTTLRIRYIAPIIPPLVILSMIGLHNIQSFFQHKKIGTSIVFILLVALFSYNVNYLADQFKLIQPFSYLSGKISRDEYITRFRPEYPVIQLANQMVPTGKVICLFMGNRGYYMNFPHLFDLPTQENSFLHRTISQATNKEDICNTLLENGYSQLLLRNDLTRKWLSTLQHHKKIAILFFQHDLKLLSTAGGYSLYKIKRVTSQ